ILIVDEALSVGDVFFQAKCYHKFEEFKKLGKTILFVSHDLGSIGKYCDRVVLLNQGVKLNEGQPKEMIDIYKKLLVNQYTEADEESQNEEQEKQEESDEGKMWKDTTSSNPDIIEYGNGMADIMDYGIMDKDGNMTNAIEKGSDFTIMFKVRFNEKISEPIFAITIKDLKGTEITGTNTMFESVGTGSAAPGDIKSVKFTQNMNLQGGDYLVSLGCTGYKNGEFTVYHRLYDVFNITVVSQKNTVGYYDMNSDIIVD
ncbi:MAG: Wzt carbohydrate-binding domain-containing protein, partial [Lachnospiraceae bacterium]|nr:Wzt carbohydrate-binding domain-containing protein [Lachnospiraceae bacterium]